MLPKHVYERIKKNNPKWFAPSFIGIYKYKWVCDKCGKKNEQLNRSGNLQKKVPIKCKFCGERFKPTVNLGVISHEENKNNKTK